jgi:hypothetical protein
MLDGAGLRALREDPPAAVVIDLSRLPSQGRDLALTLRRFKSTRPVPILFVEGDPNKVEPIRKLLPDAVYTGWSRIRGALKKAVARPPADPVVPSSQMEAYSGTPLVKKLGIKANTVVALAGAPRDFEKTLGRLPEGVKLRRQIRGSCDLVIWFTRWLKDLERRIERMAALSGKGGLWIVWPKKTSRLPSDLTQTDVRRVGLAAGLVDYKICAVDETWSGLRFTRRKGRRGR